MGPGKSRRTFWRKQTGPEMIRLSLEMYYVGSPGCMRRGKCIKNINIGRGGGEAGETSQSVRCWLLEHKD